MIKKKETVVSIVDELINHYCTVAGKERNERLVRYVSKLSSSIFIEFIEATTYRLTWDQPIFLNKQTIIVILCLCNSVVQYCI